MLTPQQWNEVFTYGTAKKKRHVVAHQVRLQLAELAPGMMISTNELGESLYPRAVAERSLVGDATRTEIFRLMGVLAKDALDDCCIKGEVCGQYMGKPRRPWLWFCPEEQNFCTQCGQVLPDECV